MIADYREASLLPDFAFNIAETLFGKPITDFYTQGIIGTFLLFVIPVMIYGINEWYFHNKRRITTNQNTLEAAWWLTVTMGACIAATVLLSGFWPVILPMAVILGLSFLVVKIIQSFK